MLLMPIYTREHLAAEIYEYLQKPTRWVRSVSRVLIGHPKPDHAAGATRFVVRVAHYDKLYYTKSVQGSVAGSRNHVYRRRRYKTSHITYVVAQISWRDAAVTELESHATKRDAMRALTAASPTLQK